MSGGKDEMFPGWAFTELPPGPIRDATGLLPPAWFVVWEPGSLEPFAHERRAFEALGIVPDFDAGDDSMAVIYATRHDAERVAAWLNEHVSGFDFRACDEAELGRLAGFA